MVLLAFPVVHQEWLEGAGSGSLVLMTLTVEVALVSALQTFSHYEGQKLCFNFRTIDSCQIINIGLSGMRKGSLMHAESQKRFHWLAPSIHMIMTHLWVY